MKKLLIILLILFGCSTYTPTPKPFCPNTPFEEWEDNVNGEYTEDFWNCIADFSNAVEDQPYYRQLVQDKYNVGWSSKRTAHFITRLYMGAFNKCIDSVGGVDIEMPDSSQLCFGKVFGDNFKGK